MSNKPMSVGDHDSVCDRRVVPLRRLVYIIISTIVLGGWYSYAQNEGMRSTNATQNNDIEHLEENQEKLEQKFDQHLRDQNIVNTQIVEKLNLISEKVIRIEQKVE